MKVSHTYTAPDGSYYAVMEKLLTVFVWRNFQWHIHAHATHMTELAEYWHNFTKGKA